MKKIKQKMCKCGQGEVDWFIEKCPHTLVWRIKQAQKRNKMKQNMSKKEDEYVGNYGLIKENTENET